MGITIDPSRSRKLNEYTSSFLHAHLDTSVSQLLTQNQDCNTLCTAYTLVTFIITIYIARRSPNRSANMNLELKSEVCPLGRARITLHLVHGSPQESLEAEAALGNHPRGRGLAYLLEWVCGRRGT
jgi:hypothetical protein